MRKICHYETELLLNTGDNKLGDMINIKIYFPSHTYMFSDYMALYSLGLFHERTYCERFHVYNVISLYQTVKKYSCTLITCRLRL